MTTNAPQISQNDRLISACTNDDATTVRKLLGAANVDVNQAAADGITALHIACIHGNEKITALLLQADADPNKMMTNGATPLYLARRNEHLEVAAMLQGAGAYTKADGSTPLHDACGNGDKKLVAELLKTAGIDPNTARIADGATPFYVACANGHVEIVNILLEAGVDANKAIDTLGTTKPYITYYDPAMLKDEGATPLFIACANGREPVVAVLLARPNIGLNKPTTEGESPLYIASKNGHKEIVRMLLKAGADLHIGIFSDFFSAFFYKSPIDAAIQHNHLEITKLLEDEFHRRKEVKLAKQTQTPTNSRENVGPPPTTIETASSSVIHTPSESLESSSEKDPILRHRKPGSGH